MLTEKNDTYFMGEALKEARVAANKGEVPVGCVIVHKNKIIAKAHNQREELKDPTAHAEMIAITQASATLESWRLEETTMYVTLEPCPMCAGAIIQSRIPTVIYGATDPKGGSCKSNNATLEYQGWNHKCEIISGLLELQCAEILIDFFKKLRESKN